MWETGQCVQVAATASAESLRLRNNTLQQGWRAEQQGLQDEAVRASRKAFKAVGVTGNYWKVLSRDMAAVRGRDVEL